MPSSNLRHHSVPSNPVPAATPSFSPSSLPAKRQKKMTVTQTYYLAHTARAKLSAEAARGDHDLRLLVGHANLLDSLMMDLQEAEREQEAWFNQTVKAAKDEPKHVVWRDTIVTEEDDFADDDGQDSDNDEDVDMTIPPRRARSPPPRTATSSAVEIDADSDAEDDDDDVSEYDEDEDNTALALVRTPSHQPPELIDDSDDSSDDEAPVSPPQPSFDLSKSFATSQSIVELKHHKSQHQQRQTPQIVESEQALLEDGFYIPGRERDVAPLVTAC